MKKCKGIIRACIRLPHLEKVKVENCKKIDNQLLEKAISFQQSIIIYCKNTSVHPDKFIAEHVDTKILETNDNNEVKYVCKNLVFWF